VAESLSHIAESSSHEAESNSYVAKSSSHVVEPSRIKHFFYEFSEGFLVFSKVFSLNFEGYLRFCAVFFVMVSSKEKKAVFF
jgi:hypothetical protein